MLSGVEEAAKNENAWPEPCGSDLSWIALYIEEYSSKFILYFDLKDLDGALIFLLTGQARKKALNEFLR